MATTTTYLGLRKPETSDTVSVTLDIANNMNTIDGWFAPVVGSTQAVGDSAAAGSASTVSRSDHKHAMPGFGSPSNVSTSNSAGVATTIARADHVHAIAAGAVRYTELAKFPHCIAYNNANQTIADATVTNLNFNSEGADTDAIHDTGTNVDRFTVPYEGVWLAIGVVEWAANATGVRDLYVSVNGTNQHVTRVMPGVATGFQMSIATFVRCAASDIIRFAVYQNSGGNLDVTTAVTNGRVIRLGSLS